MDKNFIEKQVAAIRAQVGDKKVLLGLSGGVDSSVCAALIHKAIGNNLICVFVNHGSSARASTNRSNRCSRSSSA